MSARGWTAFAAMSVVWGLPYLFIKVAVDDGLSPGFIALVGITIRSCAIDAPVMCSLAPRITTPSLRRSTTRVYASGSSCLPGGRLRSPFASVMHSTIRTSLRCAACT